MHILYLSVSMNNTGKQVCLVGARSLLASFKLLKVPFADLHVAVVIIQALGEVSSINVTRPGLLLGSLLGSSLLNRCRGTRSSSKKRGHSVSKSMSNCRSNSYTGSGRSHVGKKTRLSGLLNVGLRSGVSRSRRRWGRSMLLLLRSSHSVRRTSLGSRSRGGSSTGSRHVVLFGRCSL